MRVSYRLFIIWTRICAAPEISSDLRINPGRQSVQIMNNSEHGDHGARTLRRGLHILAALRRAPEGLDIAGIARALAMQRTSVYRYITVLAEEGSAVRDPHTRRYRAASPATHPVHETTLAVDHMAPRMVLLTAHPVDSSLDRQRGGSGPSVS